MMKNSALNIFNNFGFIKSCVFIYKIINCTKGSSVESLNKQINSHLCLPYFLQKLFKHEIGIDKLYIKSKTTKRRV